MPRVVDDHIERRIGNAAAIPIQLAVHRGCRKPGRQRAAGEHMVRSDRLAVVVEELKIARRRFVAPRLSRIWRLLISEKSANRRNVNGSGAVS
jgi:hypothetical protein